MLRLLLRRSSHACRRLSTDLPPPEAGATRKSSTAPWGLIAGASILAVGAPLAYVVVDANSSDNPPAALRRSLPPPLHFLVPLLVSEKSSSPRASTAAPKVVAAPPPLLSKETPPPPEEEVLSQNAGGEVVAGGGVPSSAGGLEGAEAKDLVSADATEAKGVEAKGTDEAKDASVHASEAKGGSVTKNALSDAAALHPKESEELLSEAKRSEGEAELLRKTAAAALALAVVELSKAQKRDSSHAPVDKEKLRRQAQDAIFRIRSWADETVRAVVRERLALPSPFGLMPQGRRSSQRRCNGAGRRARGGGGARGGGSSRGAGGGCGAERADGRDLQLAPQKHDLSEAKPRSRCSHPPPLT
jgi:hypothetical protein